MTQAEYIIIKKNLNTLKELECEQIYQRDAILLLIDMIYDLGDKKYESKRL